MTLRVFLSYPNSSCSGGFTPPPWVGASSTPTPAVAPFAFKFVAFDFSWSFSTDISHGAQNALHSLKTPQSIFNPPFFEANP